MAQTPLFALRYPNPDGSDLDDVPLWLQRLATDAESALSNISGVTSGTLTTRPNPSKANALYAVTGETAAAKLKDNGRLFLSVVTGTNPTTYGWVELGLKVLTGTLAARPVGDTAAPFTGNRIYIVVGDSTATNNGLTFFDTGSAWMQIGGGGSTVRAVAASASDVPIRSTGVASQTGNYLEAVNSGGTVLTAIKSTGRILTPTEDYSYTYNSDGTVATALKKVGGVTVSTTTFAYNSDGTPSTAIDVHDGVIDARAFTYTTTNGQTVVNTANVTRTVN